MAAWSPGDVERTSGWHTRRNVVILTADAGRAGVRRHTWWNGESRWCREAAVDDIHSSSGGSPVGSVYWCPRYTAAACEQRGELAAINSDQWRTNVATTTFYAAAMLLQPLDPAPPCPSGRISGSWLSNLFRRQQPPNTDDLVSDLLRTCLNGAAAHSRRQWTAKRHKTKQENSWRTIEENTPSSFLQTASAVSCRTLFYSS